MQDSKMVLYISKKGGSDPVTGRYIIKLGRVREPLTLKSGHIQHIQVTDYLFNRIMFDNGGPTLLKIIMNGIRKRPFGAPWILAL